MALGSFGGAGEINLSEFQKLTEKGVTIDGIIIAGGIEPDRPRTLKSIEAVNQFLINFSNGSIEIKRGPFKIYLQSYWSKLFRYPTTRKLFSPEIHEGLEGKFGVPQGTIIAFYPPMNIHDEDMLKEDKYFWLPQGWSICDGSNGTPDLRDRFICGGTENSLGAKGGNDVHIHEFTYFANEQQALALGQKSTPLDWSDRPDAAVMQSGIHLPPFLKLIYIMRK